MALNSIIDPPIPMFEVRGIPGEDGAGVIVMRVPPSAPHGFGTVCCCLREARHSL
jgi:hypothetical protein